MYYGDDIIDEVRSRNDIVDLVGTYVSLKKAGSNYMGLCPFHNEKTPSFSVSRTKQMFYCFGCGKGGNIYTFLMEYENMTFVEAVQQLADKAGITLPEASDAPGERKNREIRETIFEINAVAAKFYYSYLMDERGKQGLEYLKGRGISDEMIRHFGLGFAGVSGGNLYRYLKSNGYTDEVLKQTGLITYDNTREPYDKFWNRVMFPIIDKRKHVIGFGGRVMGDAKPKYLNSPETKVFDKSRNLYGINFLHGKLPEGVILCEGYMDVIALHQAGFTNAVAALGTSFTQGHAALLKRMADRVYVCFDSDGAGVKAAMRAIPILKEQGLSIRVIDLSPHKDPDEFLKALSIEELADRIRMAKNSFFFEVEVIERSYDMEDPESRTRFMNEIAEKFLSFEDDVERSNYMEAFARDYGVRLEDFHALVAKKSAKRAGYDYDKRREERKQNRGATEDAIAKSQGILLSWISDNPDRLPALEEYVTPESFLDEPYHSVAVLIWEQIRETGTVDASGIAGKFEEPVDQALVAGILLHATPEEADKKERVIEDVIRGVMRYNLEYKSARVTDMEQLQQLLEEKKRLSQINISL